MVKYCALVLVLLACIAVVQSRIFKQNRNWTDLESRVKPLIRKDYTSIMLDTLKKLLDKSTETTNSPPPPTTSTTPTTLTASTKSNGVGSALLALVQMLFSNVYPFTEVKRFMPLISSMPTQAMLSKIDWLSLVQSVLNNAT